MSHGASILTDGDTRTFLLPDLGEGLTEAEIVRWLVEEGENITVDQPMVEVETAKSIVEVPSPFAGRVLTRHGREGETLAVGSPLVSVISGDGATAGTPQAAPEGRTSGGVARAGAAEAYREEERAGSGNVLIGYGTSAGASASKRRRRRPRQSPSTLPDRGRTDANGRPSRQRPAAARIISPLVRRLAREHGVDLTTLAASGDHGVITRRDVERAIAATSAAASAAPDLTDEPMRAGGRSAEAAVAPVAPAESRIPMTGFRKAVAQSLSRSRSEIPEATVWVDVDATPLWELREDVRTAADPGPGLLAYIARFTIAALREFPILNSRLDTDTHEIVQLNSVNLGIAVQGERGLVVPAVMGAERLTTSDLDREIRRITASARQGRNTPEELQAGTFTLNNYGSFRVDGSAAIINHPQVAILGFGRMIERAWVVDGTIVPRRITQMSFVFDHRVCDGGTASGFMRSVADAIENPSAAIARL